MMWIMKLTETGLGLADVTCTIRHRGKRRCAVTCDFCCAFPDRINHFRVAGDYAIVHEERADAGNEGQTKTVDNDDMVSALVHFENGVKGHIGASRVTTGRKCGLRWEIHGTEGTILYDQEQLNELKLFTRRDDPATDGFRIILTMPLRMSLTPPFCPMADSIPLAIWM